MQEPLEIMKTKIIRYRQKAALERKVEELSKEGWIPKWESYRETEKGLLDRKTTFSVAMEKPEEQPQKSRFRLC